jgi:hypothetical protein
MVWQSYPKTQVVRQCERLLGDRWHLFKPPEEYNSGRGIYIQEEGEEGCGRTHDDRSTGMPRLINQDRYQSEARARC